MQEISAIKIAAMILAYGAVVTEQHPVFPDRKKILKMDCVINADFDATQEAIQQLKKHGFASVNYNELIKSYPLDLLEIRSPIRVIYCDFKCLNGETYTFYTINNGTLLSITKTLEANDDFNLALEQNLERMSSNRGLDIFVI